LTAPDQTGLHGPEGAGEPMDPGAPQRRDRERRWARAQTMFTLYGAIAAGSVIGSLLRWLASLASLSLLGPAFPWGTLVVNVTGSFAIGYYAAVTGPDGRLFVGPRTRQFVMTGICGGYTTFSMFSLETLRFLQAGNSLAASLYLALSITTWLAAVWLGDALAIRVNRLKGT
jgi:CrcB protein